MNRLFVTGALALGLSFAVMTPAAFAQVQPTSVEITKPAAGTPILVSLPQVSMNLLTTGGADPKEEWNQNTRKFLNAAAMEAITARTYTATAVDPATYESARQLQVLKLNSVVTEALVMNSWAKLPTKSSFDWTLGEGAAELRPAGETTPPPTCCF